jgi:hypothetical protein
MGGMPVLHGDTCHEYAALLRRPRYASFVLTVSLSRTTGAMFITSGVLLVLGRTGSAGLAVLYGITGPFSTGSFVSALAEVAGPELLDRGERDRGDHWPTSAGG